MYIAIIHIFLIAPLLIYVGLTKTHYKWIYMLLLLLGVSIVFNFGSKILLQGWTQRSVWYAIHMFLFAALLLYVGWFENKASDVSFSLLLAVGIAAFGYHFVRLIQRTMVF